MMEFCALFHAESGILRQTPVFGKCSLSIPMARLAIPISSARRRLRSISGRSRRSPPSCSMRYLNRVFSQFDRLAEKYRLEKIKTIGDAYMVAGGMPDPQVGHAADVANMALEILDVTRKLSSELREDLAVRIGIHTGPAVAGVIGTRKLFYDVWGDTVNTASRMEAHGSAGKKIPSARWARRFNSKDAARSKSEARARWNSIISRGERVDLRMVEAT
jgi:class 3 adenylate cyclase